MANLQMLIKISSTHPNSIPSNVLSSISKNEDMRKNPFWYFLFNWLWPFNFQFGYRPKSSNSNILVFAHPIGKLKIVTESLRSREDMVKKPFLYFDCFTYRNPCDSSTSRRANFWPGTPEKFFKHGFSFFQLLVEFSPLAHDFGCSVCLSSLWV